MCPANKALMAMHVTALPASPKAIAGLNFEAEFRGIPIVKTCAKPRGNQVTRVFRILNGTCNYSSRGCAMRAPFEPCSPMRARRLAEATDLRMRPRHAHKLAIRRLAFGTESLSTRAISKGFPRSPRRIDAPRTGYQIKLLVSPEDGERIEHRVTRPCAEP